jgi:hypothetical protein
MAQPAEILASSILEEIDQPVRTPNQLGGEISWTRTRRRKMERSAVADALAPYPRPAPGGQWTVKFTRIGPIKLDADDNLRYAFKTIKDQVADWLGVDDGQPNVRWLYAQEVQRIQVEGENILKVWFRLAIWPGHSDPPESTIFGDEPDPALRPMPGDPACKRPKRITWATVPGQVLARVSSPEAKRAPGSELVLSRRVHERTGEYLHACVHYTSGIRWRTPGVAVFGRAELLALRDACNVMLSESPGGRFPEGGSVSGEGSAQRPPSTPTGKAPLLTPKRPRGRPKAPKADPSVTRGFSPCPPSADTTTPGEAEVALAGGPNTPVPDPPDTPLPDTDPAPETPRETPSQVDGDFDPGLLSFEKAGV